MTMEQRLQRAFEEADRVEPSVDLWSRLLYSIEEDREQQLVIKTTQDRVAAIEARFQELHPYELPEFVVLSAEASTAYLGWLRDSVAVK